MAQVEFVHVIFTIFSQWKVEIVRHEGENEQEAKNRLAAIILDSSPKLTLQIIRSQDVELRWVAR